ncbi:MAG: hypothetical protein IJ291_06860 [Lachnospiraceae bacterium]|nr:hypothetical protein [Lachnospiraceae bacterium]
MKRNMKKLFKRVIAGSCAALMVLGGIIPNLGTLHVQAAEENTLWIVGDSTVSAFTDNYYYPRYGYGTQIGNYVDDTYAIRNLALSGTSSKSFTTEDNYSTLTSGIKEGDVLLVGFGHNDEKSEDEGRYTTPDSDYTKDGTFAKSLYDNYITVAKNAGAEVILCTPIVRRTADGTWSDSQLHKTNGGDYAQVIKDLGANENVNVPVVDLTSLTKALYDELGYAETLYLHAWTRSSEGSVDNTHLNIYGAKKVAWLLANAIKDTTSSLAEHIDLTAGEPTKANDLVVNPDYVEPEYDGNLPQSELYEDYVIGEGETAVAFKGSAFGNLSGSPSVENHILETDENGNMHVAVLNSRGKINSTSDGVVMYFYKVPVTSSFSLSAKMTVNSFVAENQVAFGLMARDDMYIDEKIETLASDYVVAGTRGNGVNCFYRKNGTIGGQASLTTETLEAGASYNVSIVSNSDGYTCTFGNEPAQSQGYDFALTSVDADYVYVGMFASRNADVTFKNIKLVVDGEVIADNTKTEYAVTVSNDGNGTAKANAATAAAGEKITLTATPNEGYYLKEWQVVSGEVTIEDNSFTMPASDVEVRAVFEAYPTTWDFMNDTSIMGDNGVTLEGSSGVVAGLQIDATNGKWNSTRTDGWVQVNSGTKVVIPVAGSCKVSIVAYDANYSIDGTAAIASTETFVCEGTDNQVIYEATANTYLRSISVVKFAYAEAGTADFSKTEATLTNIDGYTFTNFKDIDNPHGFQSSADDATIAIDLSHPANIIVTSCCYGAGTEGTMTSSSGTVTSATATEAAADDQLVFTVTDASAGNVVLTFASNMYIHNVMIEYIVEVGPRKVDVWDIGAKVEADTETYTNNITPALWKENGVSKSFTGAAVAFGDLSIVNKSGDRYYSTNSNLADYSYGTNFGGATVTYGDGYVSEGGYYANGSGGSGTRYLTLANVQAGDKVIIYAGIHGGSDTTFTFEGLGTASAQKESVSCAAAEYKKFEFVAEYTGTYKFWEGGSGKAMYHRVVRVPGVAVSGTISSLDVEGKYTGTEHSVKFVNNTTKQETEAVLDGENFTVTLAPGYSYTAVLVGATGFGFTADSRTVVTTDAEALTGKTGVALVIEPKETYTYSGSITGFAEGYDVSKLAITLQAPEDSNVLDVDLTIDENLGFTAILEPDVEYTLVLSGVNDYEITSSLTVNDSEDLNENITVALKAMYAVSGGYLNLAEGVAVTALSFENVDDGYTYAATLNENGFSLQLRDGAYQAKATVSGYSTITHIVVDGAAASKDLYFVSTAKAPAIDWAADIYVGYENKNHNYATVSEAVAAAAAMSPASEAQRITIHIAPGTYREQVVVSTPYISFVNDTDDEVLITGYYGIGYQYYSLDAKGYYSAEHAYDQFEKNGPADWGCTVFIKPTATAFRAEGITFENSFNRYITDEELADGVEPSGAESIDIQRKYGVDVQSKAATERAAAMVVKADKVEFKDCAFLSSQDTLFTGNAAYDVYFKNCFIEGQTDYIYGDGNVIFDACELSFKGYSEGSQGGYITAAKPSSVNGYLFRNCVVTANDELDVTPGYFGRPWGADAKVMFLNTRLESSDIIAPAGWFEMTGKPEDANFYEWNTTDLNGNAVDTSSRKSKVATAEIAATWTMSYFFDEWVPSFYVAEAENVAFTTAPFVTDNGDLNTPYPGHTLTVGYSLGTANNENDASRIQWYRVKAGEEDVLVKTSYACVDKTYKITSDDIGAQIKVVVTPMTVEGKVGEAGSYTVSEAVRDGYEDPDAEGPGAVLGEGVNVFLIGDSTVKDYSAAGLNSGGTARNEGAWGEFFQKFFDEETVTIVNHANGGRSTRNFINEGSLDEVAAQIGEGDYMFIQFGHNDCADDAGNKADRYAPLGTPDENGIYPTTPGVKVDTPAELENKGYGAQCYTYDCGGTYKWYLLQYINVAKEAGAIPVLVTPVSRMYYNADGTIRAHHDDSTTTNNAYVTAVKQLAEEQGVLLIDGFELTVDMYEDAYKACSGDTYGKQIMHTGDKTHNNKLGGLIEAAIIASAVQNMELNISYAVKTPAQVLAETTDGRTVFSINNNGVLTAYDILSEYADRATYWEGVGQNLFSAIAEKASELNGGSGEDKPDEPVNEEGLKVVLANPDEEYIYTGSALKPAIIVTNNGEELTEGVDYVVKYSNNINASTEKKPAKITVTGKGNLSGSNSTTFVIMPRDINDDEVIAGAVKVTKNSKATPVLFFNNKKLGSKDYTNADAKTKYTEDGVMRLTGKGNFCGTREISVFVVEKSELKKFNVTVGKEKLTYNGESQRPTITVTDKTDKNKVLAEGTDYIIEFGNSTVNAGTVKFTVIGIGEYIGTVAKTYKIASIAVKEGITFDADSIDADGYTFVSTGVKIDEDIIVSYGDVELVQGKDYKIVYANNKKVSSAKSKAKFTINFLGNYKGSKALKGEFTINPAPLNDDVEGLKIVTADKIYTKANVYKSAPIVTINGVALKNSDYVVSYYTDADMTKEMNSKNKVVLADDENAATVYVKIVGKGNYAPKAGEYATAEYQVVKKAATDVDLSKAKITFVDKDGNKLSKVEYTGNELEPNVKVEVKVKVNGKNQWVVVDAANYEIAYANNVNKGTAKAVITATGEGYVGSKTANFKIVNKNLKNIVDLFEDLFQ